METQHTFRRAREAARALNRTASERIDRLLLALADAVEAGTEELLAANARDRSRMNPADPAYDRLLLDRGRLLGIAADHSTKKPAWCTPRSTRRQVLRKCFCTSDARCTLCDIYLSCMNSKIM